MSQMDDLIRSLTMQYMSKGLDPFQAAVMAAKHVASNRSDSETAYREMIAAEERDPTGLFSEGGMSAGGIFGEGPVALSDHDSGARARGVQTRAQMVGVEQTAMLSQILSMQQQMQQQALLMQRQQALLEEAQRRLLGSSSGGKRSSSEERSSPDEDDPWEHPERSKRKRHR